MGEDATDKLLKDYFRDRVRAIPGTPPHTRPTPTAPPRSTPPRKAGRGAELITKLAIAAAVLVTIGMPLSGHARPTPSARMLTAVHEHFETGTVLMSGLETAHSFMKSHFAGDVNND
jgi:hypothetical protein